MRALIGIGRPGFDHPTISMAARRSTCSARKPPEWKVAPMPSSGTGTQATASAGATSSSPPRPATREPPGAIHGHIMDGPGDGQGDTTLPVGCIGEAKILPRRCVAVANAVTADAPPSRRQAHKLRTERALQQAALELFSKNGYDTTTTDEIAEQAGVSPRTFFRYFPTKESVLFVGEYDWIQSFTKHFLAQPTKLSDIEAARATLLELAPVLVRIRKALRQCEQAVASSPTLRGGVVTRQADDITRMADAIAARRGIGDPDEACLLLTNVVLVTYPRALFRWLAGPAATDPREVISEEIDLLVAALAAP